MNWTDDTIAQLRRFWEDGLSTAEIGRRLGVTKNAVVGKAHRLMLPARPSPIKRLMEGDRPARRSVARRSNSPTLAVLSALAPAPRQAEVPRAQVAIRVVPALRTAGRHSACCWPTGEPGTPSFHFCEDSAVIGKPYCAKHAAVAYVKVRDRRDDAA